MTQEQMELYLKEIVNSEALRAALQIERTQELTLSPLAQGEYNKNYTFVHPNTGQTLVLRVNLGSQMHLEDQIGYEYRALEMLAGSGRTPKPYYCLPMRADLPHGVLVMEYLAGKSLDYERDLPLAAACLADIHRMETAQGHLLAPEAPQEAMLAESRALIDAYKQSGHSETHTAVALERIFEAAERIRSNMSAPPKRTLINTELNSGNFLVADRCRLVDWEKPLYGDIAQDLGHFLAPTTTLWRTDIVLSEAERAAFLAQYRAHMGNSRLLGALEQRTEDYVKLNCLRGVSWCAMAHGAYASGAHALQNELTRKKLALYLSQDFLAEIEALLRAKS